MVAVLMRNMVETSAGVFWSFLTAWTIRVRRSIEYGFMSGIVLSQQFTKPLSEVKDSRADWGSEK